MTKYILSILMFFGVLFFGNTRAIAATHTDTFGCTPMGAVPGNASACPNAEAFSVAATAVCNAAIVYAGNYCPGFNFNYCEATRHLVNACSSTAGSGEYRCNPGWLLSGGVCVPAVCSLPWGGTIANGASVSAYQQSGCGCVSEVRACSGVTLSGSYSMSSCSPFPPINGICGSANGVIFNSAPTGGELCLVGSASAFSATNPWIWTCSGVCGGAAVPCQTSPPTNANWKEVAP